MINFTPPIKASLFVSLVYLVCYQFFLQTGSYAWLYPANIVFIVCPVLYVLFLNKTSHAKFNMMILTGKGMKLSFISSLVSSAGAAIIYLLNFYLFPVTGQSHTILKNIKDALAIIFANSFLVNLICGSLGAFFTAGLMNEKNYDRNNSGTLPSL